MKMDAMNLYLENRGFKSSRCYDSIGKQYIFVVEKDGRKLTKTFKYPATDCAAVADKYQRDFLHSLVNEFEAFACLDSDAMERAYRNLAKYHYGAYPSNEVGIVNVIFNDPATIVFWSDKTKTVVKSGENDWYDPEKGLAMAIAKKTLGNQGNYYEIFKKWLKDYEVKPGSDMSKVQIEKCDA